MWFSQKKEKEIWTERDLRTYKLSFKNGQSLSLESIFLPEPSIRASCNAI